MSVDTAHTSRKKSIHIAQNHRLDDSEISFGMRNVEPVEASRPRFLRILVFGIISTGLVEERVQITRAVRQGILLLEKLPLGPFFSLEIAGGVLTTLDKVEVTPKDRVLGGVGSNGTPEVFNHLFLH